MGVPEFQTKPIRIALFHSLRSYHGQPDEGANTYDVALSQTLNLLRAEGLVELIHFFPGKPWYRLARGLRSASHSDSSNVLFQHSIFERIFAFSPGSLVSLVIGKLGLLRTERTLKRLGIELAYLSAPTHTANMLNRTPYIFSTWDLGHRDLPTFLETASYYQWFSRERLMSAAVGRAFHIMVDSRETGEKLERTYGINKKWSAIGLLPTLPNLDKNSSHLDFDYIIYPATKWPHKNHLTLLLAFQKLTSEFSSLKLVLTGKDQTASQKISDTVRELGLQESVIDFGVLDRKEVMALIRGARALVMPSLLGPTNLPPLEALMLGTPAVVSDVHNYGTVVDSLLTKVPATDVSAWAESIREVLNSTPRDPIDFPLDGVLNTLRKVFYEFNFLKTFR